MKKNSNASESPAVKPQVKTAIKWTVFAVFTVFMYTASTSGGASSKALLLFPFAAAVAVYESEIPSAILGSAAGLLLDVSLGKLTGFTALLMCLFCAGISTLFSRLLRKNTVNYLLAFSLAGGIYLYLDYYFYYKIWGYEGYRLVLTHRLIPSALKTLAWSLPVFGAVYLIERLCGSSRKPKLEEQDKNIERV